MNKSICDVSSTVLWTRSRYLFHDVDQYDNPIYRYIYFQSRPAASAY